MISQKTTTRLTLASVAVGAAIGATALSSPTLPTMTIPSSNPMSTIFNDTLQVQSPHPVQTPTDLNSALRQLGK